MSLVKLVQATPTRKLVRISDGTNANRFIEITPEEAIVVIHEFTKIVRDEMKPKRKHRGSK
jgi:hypothetical protein